MASLNEHIETFCAIQGQHQSKDQSELKKGDLKRDLSEDQTE